MNHDAVDDDPSTAMNAVLRGCYERQVLHKFGGPPPDPDAEDADDPQVPKFSPGGDGGARMSMPVAPDPNAWFRRAAIDALEVHDSPAFVVIPGVQR